MAPKSNGELSKAGVETPRTLPTLPHLPSHTPGTVTGKGPLVSESLEC